MSESSEPRRSFVQRIGLARADAQAYYERGLLAFVAHKYEDALADLDAALGLSPGYAELYSARGLIGLEAGKLTEAQEDFEYAIKLNKRQWLAHYGIGVLAFNRKAWDTAIEAFTKAQAVAPGRPEPWYYRAVAHYNSGDSDKALADMKIALRWFGTEDKKRGEDAKKWLKALGADDEEIEKALPDSAKSKSAVHTEKRSEGGSPEKTTEHSHEGKDSKAKRPPESSDAEKEIEKE